MPPPKRKIRARGTGNGCISGVNRTMSQKIIAIVYGDFEYVEFIFSYFKSGKL
jgi:hypothetical protein